MAPSTAICFAISGGALTHRFAAASISAFGTRAAAAIVGCVSLLRLGDAAGGLDGFLWPQLFDPIAAAMSPATAMLFLCVAACLAVLPSPGRSAGRFLSVAPTFGIVVAAFALVVYALDVSALHDVLALRTMALHTALCFVLLFAALLMCRSREGWVAHLFGPGSGSRGARRLLPVFLVGALAISMAAQIGTDIGLFTHEFRLSLLVVAMAALSVVALTRNAAIENRAEARLNAANRRLEDALRDKDLLLSEINHRVKNNLQQINAMLLMERRRAVDPDARACLQALAERVHSLGLTHGALLPGGAGRHASIAAFLEALADHVRNAFALSEIGVTLEVEAGEESVNLDAATSIGLIVNELLMNSMRRAFPGGRGGAIRVVYRRAGPDARRVTVSDDGIGRSDDAGTDVGSTIVAAKAAQLGAVVERTAGPGTTTTIVVPACRLA